MLNCIELNSQRIVALKLFFQLLLLIYIFSCFRNTFRFQDRIRMLPVMKMINRTNLKKIRIQCSKLADTCKCVTIF